MSYREENERKQTPQLILEMVSGKKIALVSDAGFPSVSDPGFCLFGSAAEKDLKSCQFPVLTQLLLPWLLQGYPLTTFYFLDFLPRESSFSESLEKWKDFGVL